MPLIGNDNRLILSPLPTERKAKRQIFSQDLPQVMVFVNGLILTFTAYFILNYFIHQIIDDGFRSVSAEARTYLEDRFENLEKSLQAAGALVSFSGQMPSEQIVQNFNKTYSYGDYYDQMFWLELQPDGSYKPHALMAYKKWKSVPAELQNMVVQGVSAQKSERHNILLTSDKLPLEKDQYSFYPLVLGQKVKRGDGGYDIVYGLTYVDHIASMSFFDYRKNIQAISLSYGQNALVLYEYMRGGVDISQIGREMNKSYPVSLAAQTVQMNMFMAPTEQQQFLNKIPVLMMLFGLTLTLIGTMYVRNNLRQGQRLARVNLDLAEKNSELNHEVVEREKLNHALRKAEKENRAIIDAVTDIIFETSTEGDLLFLNETWQKITGFSAERSIGRNLFDLLYTQDQAEQRNNFNMLVKGKKGAYRAFTRLRTSDGSFRAVELAVSMLRQDESRELRVVGTITDVEERRRAERALSEAEKKYRAIVENAASGIYQVTLEGHYLSANPALAGILGFSSAEEMLRDVRNSNIDIYYSPRERERQLRDAIRAGSVDIETQVRRKDGQIIWVHENLRAVKDDDEQLLFFEGSMDNITLRKETEIALTNAKVQSDLANRAKSEFLANMSHELRTPLNAIIGFSDIIRNQAFGPVGRDEYLEYARDINDSGRRLLQVINDILDVSRIEAGERQLNEGLVDMSKVVQGALEILAPKIEASGMIVSNFVGPDVPKLIGETHAVKQMLTNILSNAVKFTPEGGRISINADLDDFGQLLVSVTDTGIGLTDEEIEKALSPFGQVNAAMSKKESGTGLGLTLVQSLMALHGGTFEMFSQKGIGTTATLIFPQKRVSMPGHEAGRGSSPATVRLGAETIFKD